MDKVLEAYGTSVEPEYNGATSDCYYYKLDNQPIQSGFEKTIAICVDKNTKKVTNISIDYSLNKTMEKLEIAAFN